MNRKLKIGVISRVKSVTVTTELAGEANLRGHDYDRIVFDTADLAHADSTFEKAKLLQYDVLYYRTALSSVWAQALQQYLNRHKRQAVNLIALEYPFLGNKAFQVLAVASAGFLTPKTVFDETDDFESVKSQVGSPFVAKACESSGGKDVHLIKSAEEYRIFLQECKKNEYIYQEYLPHDYDCRVHLINGEAVAGFTRVQYSDDFRCNYSLGASLESLNKEDESVLFPLANKISKLLGLELHVVDFLRCKTDNKYYFVEINDNPGWGKYDTPQTGVDMSALVMDSFEAAALATKVEKIDGDI